MIFLIIFLISNLSFSANNELEYQNDLKAAQEQYDMGNFDVALSFSDKLLKKYASRAEPYVIAGDSLLKLKSYKEAYNYYLKSLYLASNSMVYNKALEALYKSENSKLVTIRLKRALQENSNDFVLRNILASSFIKLKLFDEAIVESKKSLEINPWDPEALSNITISYIYKSDLKKASEYSKKALKIDTTSDKLLFIKGYLNIKLHKNYEKGEEELIKSVKINPFNILYYYNLASLYIKKNKPNYSIMVLNKAIKIEPQSKKILFALAQSYYEANQNLNAIETYKKLINIDRTDVSSYLGIGKVHLKNQQYNKAIKYFKTALKYSNGSLNKITLLEVYFQKYFLLIILICITGIAIIIFFMIKNLKSNPKL